MFNISTGENKIRHAISEKFIEHTHETLTAPGINVLLGKTAADLLYITDELLYVPNERHGTLLLPKSVKHEDAVPVYAVMPEEELVIEGAMRTFLSPQKEQICQWMSLHSPDNPLIDATVQDSISHLNELILGSEGKGKVRQEDIASTQTGLTSMGYDSTLTGQKEKIAMKTRPIVLVNQSHKLATKPGSIGVHEIMHVYQTMRPEGSVISQYTPEAMKNLFIKNELEAHHVQMLAELAMYKFSSDPAIKGNRNLLSAKAFKMDEIREEINGTDANAFEPNPKLIQALNEARIHLY